MKKKKQQKPAFIAKKKKATQSVPPFATDNPTILEGLVTAVNSVDTGYKCAEVPRSTFLALSDIRKYCNQCNFSVGI